MQAMQEKFAELKKVLKRAKTALVISHIDPDGDSIGSMLAMGKVLSRMGLAVDCLSFDGVPRVYRFLPGADKVKKELEPGAHYDLLAAVDSSDIKRLGDKINLREIADVIVNIDHHPDNTHYADINYVEKCSASAELVFKITKYLKVVIDREIAENLYVALITDTGNYRYENTSAFTFVMAEQLLKAGINTHEITTRIYDTKSLASLRILALALSTLETTPDKKAAWVGVTQDMMERVGARGEDLVGLVDIIRSVDGVEVAILFRQDHDRIKINFRSKERINVSEIARRFGGGGHVRAAGAVVNDSMDNAKTKVIAEVSKYLKALQYLV